MRRLHLAAIIYAALGLAGGLFYRKVTRSSGFTGFTKLAVVHIHLLALGLLAMLIVLALDATLGISGSRSFSWFFTTYNAGLAITAASLTWHGLLQVSGQDAWPGPSPASRVWATSCSPSGSAACWSPSTSRCAAVSPAPRTPEPCSLSPSA